MLCFECGSEATEQHHVVPRSLGGTRTIPLCPVCHGKVHGIERTNIGALIRTALAVKKARGERTGQIPYGYALAVDGRMLIPRADEQAVIAAARAYRADDRSLRWIATRLGRDGFTSRSGGSFDAMQVSRMVAPSTARFC